MGREHGGSGESKGLFLGLRVLANPGVDLCRSLQHECVSAVETRGFLGFQVLGDKERGGTEKGQAYQVTFNSMDANVVFASHVIHSCFRCLNTVVNSLTLLSITTTNEGGQRGNEKKIAKESIPHVQHICL